MAARAVRQCRPARARKLHPRQGIQIHRTSRLDVARRAGIGYELDAYWPDQRIAIEVDDWDSHRTREAFEADRARDRRLAAAGIRVVRVTAADFGGRACALDAELAALGLPRSG